MSQASIDADLFVVDGKFFTCSHSVPSHKVILYLTHLDISAGCILFQSLNSFLKNFSVWTNFNENIITCEVYNKR
jgi:hypothetical protein